MVNFLKKKRSFFAITRYERILNYILNLENNVKIKTKKEKEFVTEIRTLMDDRIERLKKVYLINNMFYFGIYFSFFSLFFSEIILLSDITSLVGKIVGFFGTTFFLIGVFLTNKFKELYYQDLNLLTSHLIAIYDDNISKKAELFETNNYNSFINFFKKRGF